MYLLYNEYNIRQAKPAIIGGIKTCSSGVDEIYRLNGRVLVWWFWKQRIR